MIYIVSVVFEVSIYEVAHSVIHHSTLIYDYQVSLFIVLSCVTENPLRLML